MPKMTNHILLFLCQPHAGPARSIGSAAYHRGDAAHPLLRLLFSLLLVMWLSACQSIPSHDVSQSEQLNDPAANDPWESWNRKVFAFNEKLDKVALRPLAEGYTKLVPEPIRLGIGNFFGNVADIWSAMNLYLQGQLKLGTEQIMRVAVNSTFGLGGLLDVASTTGLKKNSQDLGKTLGVWGVQQGPYLVPPLLGPSNVRDGIGLVGDLQFTPRSLVSDASSKNVITLTGLVDARAGLLSTSDLISSISLDKYIFVRDAFMQRRRIVSEVDMEPSQDVAPPNSDKNAEAMNPASK